MKEKSKLRIIKITIPVLIIGGCFGIDRLIKSYRDESNAKPIVVWENSSKLPGTDDKPLEVISKKNYGNIEGLSENLGFIGDDEALVGIGMNREEFYKKYPNKVDSNNNKQLDSSYNDQVGNIYKIKLSTLEKNPTGIPVKSLISDIALNSSKVVYRSDNKVYFYDFKKNINTEYKSASKGDSLNNLGNWSKDGRIFISFNDDNLKVYDSFNENVKKVKLNSGKVWLERIPGFYSRDGKDIYFIGGQSKNGNSRYQRQGIFKVNSNSGEIDDIMVTPYNDARKLNNDSNYSGIPHDYVFFDDDKKILLNASLNGVDGAYIYDINDKKFYNVIQHTVKSEEGRYSSPMWISPDETKVIYANRAIENNKECWNLYAAKISGNSFTNRACIYKNFNAVGSIDDWVQWSSDSKKVLFFTADKPIVKNNITFYDKNEVNLITFK